MDVPLIETNGKYEDSFLSVQSKYIVFTQYTHKKKKNPTKLWPVHVCQKNLQSEHEGNGH